MIDNTKKHSTALEAIKSIVPWAKRKAHSTCTRKMLYKRLPVSEWLPRYDSSFAIGDLVAGITVGLTLIPQGMAYANIAGEYYLIQNYKISSNDSIILLQITNSFER